MFKKEFFREGKYKPWLIVEYGLHKIGAQAPYFSITGQTKDTCGCIHDTILQAVPEFADFIMLHLSNSEGVPMYAVENGWYCYQQDKQRGLDYIRCTKEVPEITSKEEFAALVESLKPEYKALADKAIKQWGL